MPRVGLDGRDLLRKRTGVVNNSLHLARELTASHPNDVIVYVDRPSGGDDEAPPIDVPLRRIGAPAQVWKHVALPLRLARDHITVFHSPTGTLPALAACQQVVTLHDVFASVEPRWFSPRMGWQLRLTQRRAAHAADRVIAVSETTRRDLVVSYKAATEKIC